MSETTQQVNTKHGVQIIFNEGAPYVLPLVRSWQRLDVDVYLRDDTGEVCAQVRWAAVRFIRTLEEKPAKE